MAQKVCTDKAAKCSCIGQSGIPKITEKMFTRTEWINWALAVKETFHGPGQEASHDQWDYIVYNFRENEKADSWATDVLVIHVELTCGGSCGIDSSAK